MQDHDDPAGRPERIARQILVEYGEHVKKQVKQAKKPKKNAELLELKVRAGRLRLFGSKIEVFVSEEGSRIYGQGKQGQRARTLGRLRHVKQVKQAKKPKRKCGAFGT